MTSITETANELTLDIDVSSSLGIVRMLSQTDAQIFCGFKQHAGMYSQENISNLVSVVKHIRTVITDHMQNANANSKVIFSGCGTSGRLAFFCARNYNRLLKKHFFQDRDPEIFTYLIAGGDKALVRAQESAEDNPIQAVKDLTQILPDQQQQQPQQQQQQSHYVYVGITCGFSAAYVAGQLDYTMKRDDFASVLLGFNPAYLARTVPIESWDRTFKDVTVALASYNDDRHLFLNPVVGPEAVTGSTRMKGGSATKILLDVAFHTALRSLLAGGASAEHDDDDDDDRETLSNIAFELLQNFEQTYRFTYRDAEGISKLVDLGAHALRNSGHIYYLSFDSLGILGFIDASECVPTYGAKFHDVRGFLVNGWDSIGNKDAASMRAYGAEYHVSVQDFITDILPGLGSNDVVIMVYSEGNDANNSNFEELFGILRQIRAQQKQSKLSVVWLSQYTPVLGAGNNRNIGSSNDAATAAAAASTAKRAQLQSEIKPDHFLSVAIPFSLEESGEQYEFSAKLVFNAITTGAHVLKGMTYNNRMINVRVSNNKLFYRAVGIVAKVMNVSEQLAQNCILRAIYGDEDLEKNINNDVSVHISNAVKKERVVPIALLLATGRFETVEQAKKELEQEPIIRNVISKFTTANTHNNSNNNNNKQH